MGWRIEFLTGQLLENKAYGHQAVFARYCQRRTEELKVFARYQHGLVWAPLWDDSRIRSLVWSDDVLNFHINAGRSNVYSIGAPIIYHKQQLQTKNSTLNSRRTSLFVAPHATFDSKKSIFDSEEFKKYFPHYNGKDPLGFYVEQCLAQSSFQPIILLYYKDASDQIIDRFKEFGLKVMTLGDGVFNTQIQETYFDKTIDILQSSDEIFFCDISTLWVYSGYLRRRIVAMQDSIFQQNLNILLSAIGNPSVEDKNFFDNLVGVKSLRTPEELLDIFGSSSKKQALKYQLEFVLESGRNLCRKMMR
jgi:hypothetical protein